VASGPGHSNTLHIWANASMTWGGVAYLSTRRAIPIAFEDGTFGLCSTATFELADHPTHWDGDRAAYVPSGQLRCSKVLVDASTETLSLGTIHAIDDVHGSLFDLAYDAAADQLHVAFDTPGEPVIRLLVLDSSFQVVGADPDTEAPPSPSYDVGTISALSTRLSGPDELMLSWSHINPEADNEVTLQTQRLTRTGVFWEPTVDPVTLVTSSGSGLLLTDTAVFSDGGALVAYHDPQADGAGYGARVQVLAPDGAAEGDPMLLNQTTLGDQLAPALAVLDDDTWVGAFWGADDQVYTRHYDRGGAPVPGEDERLVTEMRAGEQAHVHAAQSPVDGAILMTWGSSHLGVFTSVVFARRFSAEGTPLGEPVQLSELAEGQAWGHGAVIANPTESGGWVVAWEQVQWVESGLSDEDQIVIRSLDAEGAPVGDPIVIEAVGKHQTVVDLVATPEGFMVAWEEYLYDMAPEGSEYELIGQLFDYDGAPLSARTTLNPEPGAMLNGVKLTYAPEAAPQAARFIVGWNAHSWLFTAGETGTDHVVLAAFEAPSDPTGELVTVTEAQIVTPQITSDPAQSYRLETLIANGSGAVACIDPGYAAFDERFYCQRFSLSLTPLGAPIYPAEVDQAMSADADAAFMSDGSWVVVWSTNFVDGPDEGVQLQHISATGQPLGPRRMVNRTWADNQYFPSVIALDTLKPTALVTWASQGPLFDSDDAVFRFVPLL